MICLDLPQGHDWKTLATTDRLTGLYNRLAIEIALGQKTTDYMLFMLDLNGFKPVNDKAGHEAGDAILKAIAASIRASSANDFVARWGGDEFLVIIDQATAADAPGIYHRLKAAVLSTRLDEHLPAEMAGHRCGVAIGWALSTETEPFKLADARMYEDKAR
jgi:diguanylate cyclase (GGDEF)-like protein